MTIAIANEASIPSAEEAARCCSSMSQSDPGVSEVRCATQISNAVMSGVEAFLTADEKTSEFLAPALFEGINRATQALSVLFINGHFGTNDEGRSFVKRLAESMSKFCGALTAVEEMPLGSSVIELMKATGRETLEIMKEVSSES